MPKESGNRSLWAGISIGLIMWSLAELWWAVSALIGQEVPYPSWADFFWIGGYLPMYVALQIRINSLPAIQSSIQKIWLGIIAAIVLAWTVFFVLIPIIQNNEVSSVLESVLNIIYPLIDLVLILFTLRILFSYQSGLYGVVWRWLAGGFALRAFADLLFAYAVTANLYYPGAQLNLLSTIGIDVPYNISYLTITVGLWRMYRLLRSYQPVESHSRPKLSLVANAHLLIFTKGDDTVIDVSKNYTKIYPNAYINGKKLDDALGISPKDTDFILHTIKTQGVLEEHVFQADITKGKTAVHISGISVPNPQNIFSGTILLLRLLVEDDFTVEQALGNEDKRLVQSILKKTGTKQKEDDEIKTLLANYYAFIIANLYNRAFVEGGSIFADTFIASLKQFSLQQGWDVEIQPNIIDVTRLSLSVTRKALPQLLEASKQFIGRITSTEEANAVIQQALSQFDEITLRHIAYHEVEQADNSRFDATKHDLLHLH